MFKTVFGHRLNQAGPLAERFELADGSELTCGGCGCQPYLAKLAHRWPSIRFGSFA